MEINLIGLVVGLIVFCVLIWGVKAILAASNIGNPLATYIYVAIVVIAVLVLVSYVTGYGHIRFN